MEKEPTFENEQNPEQQAIRLLREKGTENPEARDFLIKWTAEQEKQVKESADPEAPIQFNLRRARLYFEAGYAEEALENFEAAKMQAWNGYRDKLYQTITKEMNEIKNSIEKQK